LRVAKEATHFMVGSKTGELVCVPQTPLACRFGHPNMMPNLTTSKHRSKPMNSGSATIIYPKKYPLVFQKTPFFIEMNTRQNRDKEIHLKFGVDNLDLQGVRDWKCSPRVRLG
jgi:hypothetical protein